MIRITTLIATIGPMTTPAIQARFVELVKSIFDGVDVLDEGLEGACILSANASVQVYHHYLDQLLRHVCPF
jgi:hypothetical protein